SKEAFFSAPCFVDVEPLDTGEPLSLVEPDLLRVPEGHPVSWPVFFVPLLALGAGLVLCRAWYVFKRRTPGRAVPGSPVQKALEALARLEKNLPKTGEEVDRFYITLSKILRAFIQDRFGFPALRKTSEETLRTLSIRCALPPDPASRLESIFQETDRIKFFRKLPGRGRPGLDLSETRELVRLLCDALPDASGVDDGIPGGGAGP
ncbi:MAG: hypothetical protein KJ645_05895, partial [Planctomycetes bacterium]|nr:hypothetical protein [Planctomycetota bacterium]